MPGWERYAILDVINLSKNQFINLEAYQSAYTGTAFIVKLNNITLNNFVSANIKNDGTSSTEYTSNSDSKHILLVSMANATNRKFSYSYKGSIFKDSIEEEGMFIKYVELNREDYVSASAYGYNMGGGSTFILE